MKNTTSYILLALSLFFHFTSALLADNTVEKHDIIVDIAKKSGGSEHSKSGTTRNSFYEIIVEGKRPKVSLDLLSVEYEIFYFQASANKGKDNAYKSIKGGFNLDVHNSSKENPLVTETVTTVEKKQSTKTNNNKRGGNNKNRNNNNNKNKNNNLGKNGDSKDRILGVLVDVYENNTLIATYASTNRVRDRAKALRAKGQQITPNSFQ